MSIMAEGKIQSILGHMKQSLQCVICLEMMSHPVSTSCGHTFCRFCLLEFLEGKRHVPCPLCKKPITKRSLTEREELGGLVTGVHSLIAAFQTDTGRQYSPPRASQMRVLPGTPEVIPKKGSRKIKVSPNKTNSHGTEARRPTRRANVRRAKSRNVPEITFDDAEGEDEAMAADGDVAADEDDATDLLQLLAVGNDQEDITDDQPQINHSSTPEANGVAKKKSITNTEVCKSDCAAGRSISVQTKRHCKPGDSELVKLQITAENISKRHKEANVALDIVEDEETKMVEELNDSPNPLFHTPLEVGRNGQIQKSKEPEVRRSRRSRREETDIKYLSNVDEVSVESDVGLTPDVVDEEKDLTKAEMKVTVTYGRKDRTNNSKKRLTKQKVSKWLESCTNKDNVGTEQKEIQQQTDKDKKTVKKMKIDKKTKKFMEDELAMGQKMKHLADKMSTDEDKSMFGFEDMNSVTHNAADTDSTASCANVNTKTENMVDGAVTSKRRNKRIEAELLDDDENNLENMAEAEVTVTCNKGLGAKLLDNVETNLENKKVPHIDRISVDSGPSVQKASEHIQNVNSSSIDNQTETTMTDEHNFDKPPVQRRRIFKTRTTASNNRVNVPSVQNHEGVENVSVSVADSKDKLKEKINPTQTQTSQGDPYEFKSSQPTPVKVTKVVEKKRSKKGKAVKPILTAKDNTKGPVKEQVKTAIACDTTDQTSDFRTTRSTSSLVNDNTQAEVETTCKVAEAKKSSLKKTRRADKEVEQMAAMLNQAEEHDLLMCTQEAVDSLPKDQARKVTFKEPVISDFVQAGKIDMIAFRKAKDKFESSCTEAQFGKDKVSVNEKDVGIPYTDIFINATEDSAEKKSNIESRNEHHGQGDADLNAMHPGEGGSITAAATVDEDDDLSDDFRFQSDSGSETDDLELETEDIDLPPLNPVSTHAKNDKEGVNAGARSCSKDALALDNPGSQSNPVPVSQAVNESLRTPDLATSVSPAINVIEETPMIFAVPSLKKTFNKELTLSASISRQSLKHKRSAQVQSVSQSPAPDVIAETPMIALPENLDNKTVESIDMDANETEEVLIEDDNLEVIDKRMSGDKASSEVEAEQTQDLKTIEEDAENYTDEAVIAEDKAQVSSDSTPEDTDTLPPSLNIIPGTFEKTEEVSSSLKESQISLSIACESLTDLSESILAPMPNQKGSRAEAYKEDPVSSLIGKDVSSSLDSKKGKRKRKCFMLEETSQSLDFGTPPSDDICDNKIVTPRRKRLCRSNNSPGNSCKEGNEKILQDKAVDGQETGSAVGAVLVKATDVLGQNENSECQMIEATEDENVDNNDAEKVNSGSIDLIHETEALDVDTTLESGQEVDASVGGVDFQSQGSTTNILSSAMPHSPDMSVVSTQYPEVSPVSGRRSSSSMANTSVLLQSPPSPCGTQLSMRRLDPGESQGSKDHSLLALGESQGSKDQPLNVIEESQSNRHHSLLALGKKAKGYTCNDDIVLETEISQEKQDSAQMGQKGSLKDKNGLGENVMLSSGEALSQECQPVVKRSAYDKGAYDEDEDDDDETCMETIDSQQISQKGRKETVEMSQGRQEIPAESKGKHSDSPPFDLNKCKQPSRKKSVGRRARGFSKRIASVQDQELVISPSAKSVISQTPEKFHSPGSKKFQSPGSKFLSPKFTTQKLNLNSESSRVEQVAVCTPYKGNSKYGAKTKPGVARSKKDFTGTPEVVKLVGGGDSINQCNVSPFAKYARVTNVEHIDTDEELIKDNCDSEIFDDKLDTAAMDEAEDDCKDGCDDHFDSSSGVVIKNHCERDIHDDKEDLFAVSENKKKYGDLPRLLMKKADTDGDFISYENNQSDDTKEVNDDIKVADDDETCEIPDEDKEDVTTVKDSCEQRVGYVDNSQLSESPEFTLDSSPEMTNHQAVASPAVKEVIDEYEQLKQSVVRCLVDQDNVDLTDKQTNDLSSSQNRSRQSKRKARASLEARLENSRHLDSSDDEDVIRPSVGAAVIVDDDEDDDGDVESSDDGEEEKMIIEESDVDDDGSRPMNLTSSSAISSMSEDLTTQDRLNMEAELERMATEMKDIMAQMKQKKVNRGQQNSSHIEMDSEDDDGRVDREDIEDEDDLLLVPDDVDDIAGVTDHADEVVTEPEDVDDFGGAPSISLCEQDVYREEDQGEASLQQSTGQPEDQSVTMTMDQQSPKRPVLSEVDMNVDSEAASPVPRLRGFVATGLSMSQNMECMKLASKNDVKFSSKFHNNFSHVIVKPALEDRYVCDRTLKFFQGLAHGCWIVSYDWVHDSLSQGRLLPEEDFEIRGDTNSSTPHQGPRRARLSKKTLFQGLKFALLGDNSHLPRDSLAELVSVCGGCVVDLSQLSQGHRKLLVISCTDLEGEEETESRAVLDQSKELYRQGGWLTLSREWVLDSLSAFKRQPMRDYIVNDHRSGRT